MRRCGVGRIMMQALGDFFASPVLAPRRRQATCPDGSRRIAKGAAVEAVVITAGRRRDTGCGADGVVVTVEVYLRRSNISVDLPAEFRRKLHQRALSLAVNMGFRRHDRREVGGRRQGRTQDSGGGTTGRTWTSNKEEQAVSTTR